MANQTQIGPILLTDTGERRAVEAETTDGVWSRGDARVYTARFPDGALVELGDVTFPTDRDVRMLSRGPVEALDRLLRGMRVGVQREDRDRLSVRLRIPAEGSRPGHITPHQTTLAELSDACGFDVKEALVSAGARAVDRRELALGDKGRPRNELCVVFDHDNTLVPAIAYVITPLIAFWERYC